MESSNKRKWQIRAGVLGVFLLGFIAGALALNFYEKYRSPSVRATRAGRFEHILSQLDLNETQKTEVEKIMKETRTKMMSIRQQSAPLIRDARKEMDDRISAVLTPEQLEKWRQLMRETRPYRGRGGEGGR